MSLAAEQKLRSLGNSVLNVFLHFLYGRMVDQRTLDHSGLEAVAHFKLPYRCNQFLGKGVINAGLDIEPVSANAGLTSVAVFGNYRSFNGRIQISIIENDEGRIASEFQRDLFDGVSALLHEFATHLGRAGKGDFAYVRVGG